MNCGNIVTKRMIFVSFQIEILQIWFLVIGLCICSRLVVLLGMPLVCGSFMRQLLCLEFRAYFVVKLMELYP